MRMVQSAYRNDQMAHADVERRSERFLDPELLQFHFASLFDLTLPFTGFGVFFFDGRTGTGMLEFDLSLHGPAFSEVVSEIDHGMGDIEATVSLVISVITGMRITINIVTVEIARQGDFTVTSDGQAPAGIPGLRRKQGCGQNAEENHS